MGAPEVNQVLPELPVLGELVKNLYDCHYDKFFVALGMSFPPHRYFVFLLTSLRMIPTATLEQTHLLPSRVLSPHARFYVREMRILAYAQLLESYRSLTLESLSGAFGVSVDFVDRYHFTSHSSTFPRPLTPFTFLLANFPASSPTAACTPPLTRCMASLRQHGRA